MNLKSEISSQKSQNAIGVDYEQWKALTMVALKLDFRTSSLGQSQFRREASQVLGLLGQFIFYTVVGTALAFLVWLSGDLFLTGTVAMTYTIFMVGTAVLIDHSSALASPTDYSILGFRPVNSRTYFAVRLTNVLVYTTAITTVAAWIPIAAYFLRHGVAVGIASVLAFYACSIATVLTILVAYAWMLRVFGANTVKRALSYLQFAMSFMVYGGYFFVAGIVSRNVMSSFALAKTPLLLLYPATWFGAYLELATGKFTALEIVPAAASLATLTVLGAALGSRLSLDYSSRLAALTSVSEAPKTGRPRRSLWFRTGEARGVALLVRSQFRNDQRFRLGVLGMLPMTVVYLFVALRGGPIQDPFVERSGQTGFMPVTMALMMLPSLLKLHLTNSESFRASWIFFAAPADRTTIIRSSTSVLTAFFLLPYMLFLIALYSYLVGNVVHVAVHIALQGLVGYLALQIVMLIDPALPFSRPVQKSRNSIVMVLFLMATSVVSVMIDAFSPALYGSGIATVAAFASIAGCSVIVDWLTRTRIEREARSLEFEG